MDGVGSGLFGNFQDFLDHQVGLAGRSRTNVVGLVRHAHMQGASVGVRINSHGRDAHFPAGSNNPARDLPSVRN